MIKDFINLFDFTGEQLGRLIERAIADKRLLAEGKLPAALARKTLAMVFEKPSLRTRVSFETAMTQLGGHAIYLAPADIGLGKRECAGDVARVLGRMCDGIMARLFEHELMEELARYAPCPVINGLTDQNHPCQAMADLMTIREHLGEVRGKNLIFVGDGNNVARSLAVGCARLGVNFTLVCPPGYELDEAFLSKLRDAERGASCAVSHDPKEAVASADVIYTDTWVSMGQEQEKERRIRDFPGYQVNSDMLAGARSGAVVLHCLPAYRGYEISEDVFEAHAETIFTQAENRLHFQRALVNVLLVDGGIQ